VKDQTLLCGYESGFIRHYDLRSGRCEAEFSTQSWSRAVKANGVNLASGHEDGRLVLWDLRSREAVSTITVHTDKVLAIAWRDKLLASGGADSSLRLHSF
jgi:WD40 repeat protein